MWLQKIKERFLLGLNNSSHTPFFYILIAWGQDKSSWGEGIENRNSRLTFACHFLCTGSFVCIISDIWASQALFMVVIGGSKSKPLPCLLLHQPLLLLLFLIVGWREKKGFLSKLMLLTQHVRGSLAPSEELRGRQREVPEPEQPRQKINRHVGFSDI